MVHLVGFPNNSSTRLFRDSAITHRHHMTSISLLFTELAAKAQQHIDIADPLKYNPSQGSHLGMVLNKTPRIMSATFIAPRLVSMWSPYGPAAYQFQYFEILSPQRIDSAGVSEACIQWSLIRFCGAQMRIAVGVRLQPELRVASHKRRYRSIRIAIPGDLIYGIIC